MSFSADVCAFELRLIFLSVTHANNTGNEACIDYNIIWKDIESRKIQETGNVEYGTMLGTFSKYFTNSREFLSLKKVLKQWPFIYIPMNTGKNN